MGQSKPTRFMIKDLGSGGLVRLACSDYGFDCDFVSDGEIELVLETFGKHTLEEHGIEYQKEALMQIILRKNGKA